MTVIDVIGLIQEVRIKQVIVYGILLDDQSSMKRIDLGIIDRLMNPWDNFGLDPIPDISCVVLGDNRDHSLDSRLWGYV